ncbi:hypothetical protein M427DRAFT_50874, partial [Gonapodya prolifera JEL478]
MFDASHSFFHLDTYNTPFTCTCRILASTRQASSRTPWEPALPCSLPLTAGARRISTD